MKQTSKPEKPAVRLHAVGRPLRETADAIFAHLKQMEGDPSVNTETTKGLKRYYGASAWVAGRYVGVQYISYQGGSNLTRADAEWYLKWLDGGGEGRHYEALRERPTDPALRPPKGDVR